VSSRLGLSTRNVLRMVAAVTVTSAFCAMPSAWAGEAPGESRLPACTAGQVPTQQTPCRLPICADGVSSTQEHPCFPRCPQGVSPTQEHPCVPSTPPAPSNSGSGKDGATPPPSQSGPPAGPTQGDPGKGGDSGKGDGSGKGDAGKAGPGDGTGKPAGDGSQCAPPGDGEAGAASECGMPDFAPRFLSHVWRFTGDADSYDADANILNMTVTKVLNLPKKMADQDDEIVDQDAYVVFSATTKVFDKNGKRLARESKYDNALDDATSVKVAGKMMPPKKWQNDEDGNPVTTIRAKQVTIVS